MGTGMSTGNRGKRSKNDWERFSNFKERGEWVELQFMAQAAQRRFAVSKPWGDTRAYDVGRRHYLPCGDRSSCRHWPKNWRIPNQRRNLQR